MSLAEVRGAAGGSISEGITFIRGHARKGDILIQVCCSIFFLSENKECLTSFLRPTMIAMNGFLD